MANLTFHIQFSSRASTDLMHRVLNFVEDLDRRAQGDEIGSVNEINRYGSGIFLFRTSSVRQLGQASALIGKLLDRHMLKGGAMVTRAAA